MTSPPPNPTMTPDRAFELLTKFINAADAAKRPEIQQRINAHVKAVAGCTLLAQYHTSKATDAEKTSVYQTCLRALTNGCDWSKLQGQDMIGKGDKRADPLAVVPAASPTSLPAASPAIRIADIPPFEPRAVTPAPAPVAALDRSRMSPIALSIYTELEPFLPKPEASASPVDEDAVRALVTEGLIDLPDKVKATVDKHLGNGGFPAERVQKLIDEALAGLGTRVLIETPQGTTREMERQHFKFPLLLTAVNAGLNVALVGPAGSGKTFAASAVAKALEMEYAATSFGPMTSKADLFGFRDANGKYHETDLVRLAVKGGVYLGDEFDAGNAGVGTYLNTLTANGHFGTPDGMKTKSDKFRMIIGMNTYGTGASRVYVGRNQMDGATLDRYAFIEWPYDEGLEAHTIGVTAKSPKFDMSEGGTMKPKEWLEYVQKVRAACDKLAIRQIVSPRASQYGATLFASKVGRVHVENMVLWKGIETATKQKIVGAL